MVATSSEEGVEMPDTMTAVMRGLNLAAAIQEEERKALRGRRWKEEDLEAQRAHQMDLMNLQASSASERLAAELESRGEIAGLASTTQLRLQTMADVSRSNLQRMIGGQRMGELGYERGTRKGLLTQEQEYEAPFRGRALDIAEKAPYINLWGDVLRAGGLPEGGRYVSPEFTGLPGLQMMDPETRDQIAFITAHTGALREQYQALKAVMDELGKTRAEIADMMIEDPSFFKQKGRGLLGIGGPFGARSPSEFSQVFGGEAPDYFIDLMEMKEDVLQGLMGIGFYGEPLAEGPLSRARRLTGEGRKRRGPGPLLGDTFTGRMGATARSLNVPAGGLRAAVPITTEAPTVAPGGALSAFSPLAPDTGLRLGTEADVAEFAKWEYAPDIEAAIKYLIDAGVASGRTGIDRNAAIRILMGEVGGIDFSKLRRIRQIGR